jgi:hypothetical protein
MSNTNTIAGFVGTGTSRNQFPVQTIAEGTEVLLQVATDSGTNVAAYVTVPTGGSVFGAQGPLDVNANPSITGRSGREYGNPNGQSNDQFSSASWTAHPFYVRISGTGTGGTGDSVIVNLRCGASATFSSNPIIGTTGAAYAAAGAFNWAIESVVLWDATSGYGGGTYSAILNSVTGLQVKTPTAYSQLTGITAAGLVFCASAIFSVGSASSTIQVQEFVVEKV